MARSNNATSLAFTAPRFAANGSHHYNGTYPIMQFETDVPASEATCNFNNGTGCTVPLQERSSTPSIAWRIRGTRCVFLFGNMTHDVNTFGKDAQYGTPNLAWLVEPPARTSG